MIGINTGYFVAIARNIKGDRVYFSDSGDGSYDTFDPDYTHAFLTKNIDDLRTRAQRVRTKSDVTNIQIRRVLLG